MTRTNAISRRGLRYIAAILILALGAVAISLITAKPASAQQSAQPTLTAAASETGMVLNWTVSGGVNGWTVSSFAVLRTVGDGSTNVIASNLAGTARTYTDQFGSNALTQWLDGTDLSYAVRASYKRGSQSFQRTSSAVVIESPTSATELRNGYAPKNLTSVAHADGVKLSWTFDEATMTPDGWKLAGFTIWRWIQREDTNSFAWVQGSFAYVDNRIDPAVRTLTDPLTGSTEEQRLPGGKFTYEMNAYFHRIADGLEGPGDSSNRHVFTAPTMPSPLNFKIGYRPGTRLSTVLPRSLLLSWERPHLSWDASTGFTGIDQYHFYRGWNGYEDGSHWLSITGQYTSHTWNTQWYCQGPFQLLAQYGLFYSDLVTSSEGREDC